MPREWSHTTERFVAFIDIMGFRDRVYRNSHDSVLTLMKKLQPTIESIKSMGERQLAEGHKFSSNTKLDRSIRPVLFSDSILLVSEDDSEGSFFEIIAAARWIMRGALLNSVPVKGAIAHGIQTADFNQSLHFGRPLIDAYELQDELFLYAIALHHSIEEHITNKKLLDRYFEQNLVIKYKTPLKNNFVTHLLLGYSTNLITDNNLEVVVSDLYRTVSGSTRKYVDNTLDFGLTQKKLYEEQQNKSK
jgi:hypothetical protein